MNKLEISLVKFRNGLNKVFPNSKAHFFSSAIITAAGSGTRMGGVSKQLLNLQGTPCILYSLMAFQECPDISEIIVVAKEDERARIESLCRENAISKLTAVVAGGLTRQESVRNGFCAVSKKSCFVAIHDAARPLIRGEHISMLLKEARRWGASCAAKKVTDTIKRVNKKGFVFETVPREDLYSVQTPQVFKTDLYRVSLALSEKKGIEVTDDCSLAEYAGFTVRPVDLGIQNVKITLPEDMELVNTLLKERKNV